MITAPKGTPTTATNTSSASIALTAPSGASTGDLALVFITANGTSVTYADNNGSTAFTKDFQSDEGVAGGMTLGIFSRILQAGDPGTYNFTISSGAARYGAIACLISSPNVASIYNVAPTAGNNSAVAGTSGTAITITTKNDNSIHFVIMAPDGASNTVTAVPAGYTAFGTVSVDQSLALAYKVVAAGATGSQSFSWTNSDTYIAASLAVNNLPIRRQLQPLRPHVFSPGLAR